MKFKSFVAAATLALSSLGAFATGTSTFSGNIASFNSWLFTSSGFTQTIDFSGLTTGTYDISGDISGSGLTFTSVSLDGTLWDLYADNKGRIRFGSVEITSASSPVSLTVIGNVSGSLRTANYSGSLTVTAVPEPETYSMLLAGLGLMGAIARRRNKAGAA